MAWCILDLFCQFTAFLASRCFGGLCVLGYLQHFSITFVSQVCVFLPLHRLRHFSTFSVALVRLRVFGLRLQSHRYTTRYTTLIKCCGFNAGECWIYLFTAVDVGLLRTSACAAEIKYCALETRNWQAWTVSRWHRYWSSCKNIQQ